MSQSTPEVFEAHEDAYAMPDSALTYNHNESAVFEVREDAYSTPDAALTYNHNEILIEA
ncbi:hypothetical protein AAH991_04420 [Microbispora sp. ZYX-F-249]|uniref:Uncharacterized protein n=1 Tax=Microbispora maris TaxID=3144104 RepID=A0ABV0AG66_9ACTN